VFQFFYSVYNSKLRLVFEYVFFYFSFSWMYKLKSRREESGWVGQCLTEPTDQRTASIHWLVGKWRIGKLTNTTCLVVHQKSIIMVALLTWHHITWYFNRSKVVCAWSWDQLENFLTFSYGERRRGPREVNFQEREQEKNILKYEDWTYQQKKSVILT